MLLRRCTSPLPRRSMRILFDQGTPEPLIPFLRGHLITTAKDAGWPKQPGMKCW
jgi:hypothetical protein